MLCTSIHCGVMWQNSTAALIEILHSVRAGNERELRPHRVTAPGRITNLTVLHLHESTRIADGDLEPLLGLRHLRDFRMMNRNHHRPAVSEIKEHLGLKA